jgi:hypothetical protein
MGVHPPKKSREQRLVAAGDAHRGGFTAWKHQGMELFINVVGSPALDHFDLKAEFLGRTAKGFSMLVTSALKHRQTHTEHDAGSMPFPISPTLQVNQQGGLSSMHFKNRRDHQRPWLTRVIASLFPARFA